LAILSYVSGIEAQFADLSKIPLDWQSERNFGHMTYQGESLNVHTESRRTKSVESEGENLVYEEGLGGFVQQFRLELGVTLPGIELDSFRLAADFGSLIQQRTHGGLKG
jgi:hypothetical protein